MYKSLLSKNRKLNIENLKFAFTVILRVEMHHYRCFKSTALYQKGNSRLKAKRSVWNLESKQSETNLPQEFSDWFVSFACSCPKFIRNEAKP
jgi:hypothetical protein